MFGTVMFAEIKDTYIHTVQYQAIFILMADQ